MGKCICNEMCLSLGVEYREREVSKLLSKVSEANIFNVAQCFLESADKCLMACYDFEIYPLQVKGAIFYCIIYCQALQFGSGIPQLCRVE